MISLLLLLIVPICGPFICKAIWPHDLTWEEFAANIAVGVLIVLTGMGLSYFRNTGDIEIINGKLTSKASERVSCSHSYSCNCRTVTRGSGENRRTERVCDTCYRHPYDVSHRLYTTIGRITVDRIDSQGLKVPPRFERAQVGDPVADTHYHTNYIKAAPDSLFNRTQVAILQERFKDNLPEYPSKLYDYHYVDRVLAAGVNVPDLSVWNKELALALRDRGVSKQVNIVVVITKATDPDYATALDAKWLGGKKNDVVVVLGAPEYPKQQWVRIISWTDEQIFKVELRDALMKHEMLDPVKVMAEIGTHIDQSFKRKSMKDFKYLEASIEPPAWLLVTLFLLSTFASLACTYCFVRNDVRTEKAKPKPYTRNW